MIRLANPENFRESANANANALQNDSISRSSKFNEQITCKKELLKEGELNLDQYDNYSLQIQSGQGQPMDYSSKGPNYQQAAITIHLMIEKQSAKVQLNLQKGPKSR